MKAASLIVIGLFVVCITQAQEFQWYRGSVVLASQEVKQGEFAVNTRYNIVLFRTDSAFKVLPAHQISSVFIYDGNANINRKFIALTNPDHHRQVMLYEVVVRGEVEILRRQKQLSSHNLSDRDDYQYWVHRAHSLSLLTNFAGRMYTDLLMQGGSAMEEFVASNSLHAHKPADAIRIIRYYNQLFAAQQASSKALAL